MRMRFRQKAFSLYGKYDIYGEDDDILYTVRGERWWGKCLRVYDRQENEVGMVKQKLWSLMPTFDIFMTGNTGEETEIGRITKKLTFVRNRYDIDFNGWQVDGNFWELNYSIVDANGDHVASISKELFKMMDTYIIDVDDPALSLEALMFVVAIDVEKETRLA